MLFNVVLSFTRQTRTNLERKPAIFNKPTIDIITIIIHSADDKHWERFIVSHKYT